MKHGRRNHGVLGTTTAADAADPSWIAVSSSRYYKRNALRFGGDDFVTVADSPTLEPRNISVGAVVRATTSPGAFRYVVAKGALVFVDGKEVGTGTPTSISLTYGFPDNDAFYIGDYRGTCASPLGFIGDIDAVAVANRAFAWTGA